MRDDTDGEISDGSILLISGNEFTKDKDADDDQSALSSVPPTPPATVAQAFWMRAHQPDVSLLSRDLYDGASKCQAIERSTKKEWKTKNKRDAPADGQTDPDAPNFFWNALILFNILLCCELLLQYVISSAKIKRLQNEVDRYIHENNNLNAQVDSLEQTIFSDPARSLHCNCDMAAVHGADYDERKREQKQQTLEQPVNFILEQANKNRDTKLNMKDEPQGRKVWTGEGLTPQAIHLAPKTDFKYDELCNKQKDDLFSEYANEYCEKVRKTSAHPDGKHRAPVHAHRAGEYDPKKSLFAEDFIDPNKFNPVDVYKVAQEELAAEKDQKKSPEFENALFEPNIPISLNSHSLEEYEKTIPTGFHSFEDALIEMDEHMERISFYSNSCYTKYKKLRDDQDDERKSYKKYDKRERDARKKHKREEKNQDKRDKRGDKKREKGKGRN